MKFIFRTSINALLVLFLFAAALIAATPATADDVTNVYRADVITPQELEEQGGFIPKGYNAGQPNGLDPSTSLFEHTLGTDGASGGTDSGYISTTTDPDFALRFVTGILRGDGYIYRIHTTPNFIDAAGTLGRFYQYSHEREYSALGFINFRQVIGWTEVIDGEPGLETRNPRYDPSFNSFRAGGAQPQLAGFPRGHEAWQEDPWRQFAGCDRYKRSAEEQECSPTQSSLEAANAYFTQIDAESWDPLARSSYYVKATKIQVNNGGDGSGDDDYEVYGDAMVYSPDPGGTPFKPYENSIVQINDSRPLTLPYNSDYGYLSDYVNIDSRPIASIDALRFGPTFCLSTNVNGGFFEYDASSATDQIVGGEKSGCTKVEFNGTNIGAGAIEIRGPGENVVNITIEAEKVNS